MANLSTLLGNQFKGEGVAAGGATGQALVKASTTDYDSVWSDVVAPTSIQTLTNKRITSRVVNAGTTSGNITPTGNTADVFNVYGLTGDITVLTPSGTPTDGQRLIIRLEDDGTGRAITWTTSSGAFRAVGVTLPITTVASKITVIGCIYNSTDTFWDVVAVTTQA